MLIPTVYQIQEVCQQNPFLKEIQLVPELSMGKGHKHQYSMKAAEKSIKRRIVF